MSEGRKCVRWNKRQEGRRQPDVVTSQCSAQLESLDKDEQCSTPCARWTEVAEREMLENWGTKAKALRNAGRRRYLGYGVGEMHLSKYMPR